MQGDSSKPTRWAIVGTGTISGDFCLALRTLPQQDHKIVAVAARSLENAQKFAEKHGIEKVYGSYESIAEDPDVDVVYIGTFNPSHVPLSVMMLEAEKAVLCEKPLAMSPAGVNKVVQLARQKNKLIVEGLWSRFFPAYKQLRTELKSGTIGSVRGLTAHFGVEFPQFVLDRMEDQRGGVTFAIGCYLVQLACLVFDNEKPIRIHAFGSVNSAGVDISSSVLLCYKDGRTAQLITSMVCPLSNSAVVYGTNGTLEFPSNLWKPDQLKTPKECSTYPLPVPAAGLKSGGFVYEIEAVRQALLSGKTEVAEVTQADSLLIAEIQDEILRQLGISYSTL